MAKFNSLKKRDLKNAQHFAFIQAFITSVTAAEFAAQRIVAKLAELVSAFATEDQYYMRFRASEIVAQREEADSRRDRSYTRLHRLVLAWAGCSVAQMDEAATAVLRIFNLYKVKINAQIDEETGQMENLITDLLAPEMQAHLTTLNGMTFFTEMKTAQDEVKALRLQEGAEVSEKVFGALASARTECDRLYDELTDMIEGASAFADDPTQYDAFIKLWNGTIKIYQDMLDRKSGTSSNNNGQNGQNNQSEQGGTEQGGGTENGGTENGGDDNGGGDNGGNGQLIDDPELDDNNGGQNGGGSNNNNGDGNGVLIDDEDGD